MILIDKRFAANPYLSTEGKDEIDRIIDRFKKIDVPIFVGGIKRAEPEEKATYRLPESFRKKYLMDGAEQDESPPSQWKGSFLGPNEHIRGVFNLSHITYKSGDQVVYPHIEVEHDKVVPHLSLSAAESIKYKNDDLYINGKRVPLSSRGGALINYRDPRWKDCFVKAGSKRTCIFDVKSLKFYVDRARRGVEEKRINADDIVFIVPGYFTGTSDIHEGGPFGEIHGGLIVATMIDSVLNGNWLTPFLDYTTHLIILLSVWGWFVGHKSNTQSFWFLLVGHLVFFFVLVMYLFSYHSIVISWVFPLAAFFGVALSNYGVKMLSGEISRLELRKRLFQEKVRRQHEESQKKILEERLFLGKTVQEMLLPKRQQGVFNNMDYKMRYEPSQQMSGDWLYYWEFSDTEKRIFIGDVVGKGPPAALPVAVIISTFKEAESSKLSVADTISLLNHRVLEHFDTKVTSTLAAVVLHKDKCVNFVNAGSPGWFLVFDDEVSHLSLRSSPLGLKPDNRGVEHSIEIDRNAMLFTYTDGYMEGARASKRLISYIKKQGYSSLSHDSLHQGLLEIGEGFRLEDDMTMVSVKVKPAS